MAVAENEADIAQVLTGSEMMAVALEEAKLAAERGEVPVGAVISRKGMIISRGGNRTIGSNDPTAHAEIVAIRMACEALNTSRLTDCDLHVTLEPCTMCAGAISHARLRRLYYGAADQKGGAVENGPRFFTLPTCLHAPDIYSGIQENEAAKMLRDFFKARR
jgi:tRNA(adenine34) deaminase